MTKKSLDLMVLTDQLLLLRLLRQQYLLHQTGLMGLMGLLILLVLKGLMDQMLLLFV
jgi:hypothetical protein